MLASRDALDSPRRASHAWTCAGTLTIRSRHCDVLVQRPTPRRRVRSGAACSSRTTNTPCIPSKRDRGRKRVAQSGRRRGAAGFGGRSRTAGSRPCRPVTGARECDASSLRGRSLLLLCTQPFAVCGHSGVVVTSETDALLPNRAGLPAPDAGLSTNRPACRARVGHSAQCGSLLGHACLITRPPSPDAR
jgi:hypothetical protein